MSRSITSAVLYAVDSISALFFSLATLALIARHFGPEQYGVYGVAQSAAIMFVALIPLGIEQLVVREVASLNAKTSFLKSVNSITYAGACFYGLAILLFCLLTGVDSSQYPVFGAVAVGTAFTKVGYFRLFYSANGKATAIAVSAAVSRALALLYVAIGYKYDLSFYVVVWYYPLQTAVAATILWFYGVRETGVGWSVSGFDFLAVKTLLRDGRPLCIGGALYYFYSQSDVAICALLLPKNEVGLYTAAIRLIPLAAFIGFSLLGAFYPNLQVKFKEDKEAFWCDLKKVLTTVYFMVVPLVAFTVIFAGKIVGLLYGPQYEQSALVLRVAALSWLFLIPAPIFTRYVVMVGAGRIELSKMIVVAPIAVVLNYILIKSYGLIGGAVGVVLCYATVDFLVYALFKETRPILWAALQALGRIAIQPLASAAEVKKLLWAKVAR